jgi:hypothetical protein
VSVAVTGAVGVGGVGAIAKPDACVISSNASALAAANGTGTVSFLCTYNSPTTALGASTLKFRAQTAGAGERVSRVWAHKCVAA